MFCWTTVSFNYYLLLFHLPKLNGNIYVNGTSLALAELCGNLVIGVLLLQFGLKSTMIGSFSIMCLSSILVIYPLFEVSIWYAIILFILKFAHTSAFASVFYGTNALFMDDLVAVIFTLCNLMARMITALAPFAAICETKTVMTIYLCLSLFSIMCTSFISESSSSTIPPAVSSSTNAGSSARKKRSTRGKAKRQGK
jgi:hypothetical protein